MTQTMNLWEANVPLLTEGEHAPTMTYYRAEGQRSRSAIVIFPGGGYSHRSVHEGEGYALRFNTMGIDAFVVDYRVLPSHFPAPLLDARRAVRLVKSMADTLDIDCEKIAVMGSSAGGHLAAMTSSYRGRLCGEGCDDIDSVDESVAMQILCYPVLDSCGNIGSYVNLLGAGNMRKASIREVTPSLHLGSHTPPTFIWHTSCDPVVDVANTYRYANALCEHDIMHEMHIYPIGNHGLGLADREGADRNVPYVQRWIEELERFLKLNKFI